MRGPLVVLAATLAACSSAKPAPPTVASTRAPPPPAAPVFAPEPTPELLGGAKCTSVDHELGDGLAIGRFLDVQLGFGPSGGLAVRQLPGERFALRRVEACDDGNPDRLLRRWSRSRAIRPRPSRGSRAAGPSRGTRAPSRT